ncbi:MAG TPA: DUF2167 domain-containing protein [Ideonella sp.]|uniref:DUF2167 domain-containing protein n=1 Tax=Ideonella sp. TaxID=1929293 RepID=UPI002E344722|nr:DUF2167 domain-containing protein [Ideonella sp.]HEX5684240.1 DUF2167 domain-containing protein [Ideonella sp.]
MFRTFACTWAIRIARLLAITAPLALMPAAHAADEARPDGQQAWDEAATVAQSGPVDIKLLDKAVLKLPEGRIFIPQPQATKLLQAMGNPGEDPRLQGLVFPKGEEQGWFMTVRYEDSGHIKDDDAKDWNADDLLQSFKEGTEESNKEREKMGVPALEIIGWAEKPAYEASTHRLVWAMSSREKGSTDTDDQGVNYNTYLLGREGYFSMNLVTGLKELPAHKPDGQAMLAALNFNDGQRYSDFDEKTDHVAEYGLAALVLGVGAKKLGLLAAAGVFFAKFAKLFIFGGLGLLALVGKLFSRKSKPTA